MNRRVSSCWPHELVKKGEKTYLNPATNLLQRNTHNDICLGRSRGSCDENEAVRCAVVEELKKRFTTAQAIPRGRMAVVGHNSGRCRQERADGNLSVDFGIFIIVRKDVANENPDRETVVGLVQNRKIVNCETVLRGYGGIPSE